MISSISRLIEQFKDWFIYWRNMLCLRFVQSIFNAKFLHFLQIFQFDIDKLCANCKCKNFVKILCLRDFRQKQSLIEQIFPDWLSCSFFIYISLNFILQLSFLLRKWLKLKMFSFCFCIIKKKWNELFCLKQQLLTLIQTQKLPVFSQSACFCYICN